jgi:cytochrome c oxidase cbb3-type subunit II
MTANEPERFPAHPPVEQTYAREPRRRALLMTPHLAAIGGMLAFFTVVLAVVVLPTATYNPPASSNWLPLSDAAARGRNIYLSNGCEYCHSSFTRPQDTFDSQYYLYKRVALAGDYYGSDEAPNILGTERTGPDLSQEGGVHPDQWHAAHYNNPRNVQPLSVMPVFSFLSEADANDLIAFNQSAGGKTATLRNAATVVGHKLDGISGGNDPNEVFPDLVVAAQAAGTYVADGTPDDTDSSGLSWGDIYDLNTFERSYWLTQDPLDVTEANLNKGRAVFEARCSGCHGPTGLGDGPGAQLLDPTPDDFSDPGMFSSATDGDGERYHRILTGGRGSAMEDFGQRLSVEEIWQVILFLRTIPNGGFEEPVTTVDTYQPWTAPEELVNYTKSHPIEELAPINPSTEDPFMSAARWILGGLAPEDTILLGGKLPITLDDVASEIKAEYTAEVTQDYNDAVARGEKMPPEDSIMSTDGLTWISP